MLSGFGEGATNMAYRVEFIITGRRSIPSFVLMVGCVAASMFVLSRSLWVVFP